MSTSAPTFQKCVAAIDALRLHVGPDAANNSETLTQCALEHKADIVWAKGHLAPLASALLPAGFRLSLQAKIDDFEPKWELRQDASGLAAEYSEPDQDGQDTPSELAPGAVGEFTNFKADLCAPGGKLLEDLLDRLEKLANVGAPAGLSAQIFLDKGQVNSALADSVAEEQRPKVISFLFAKELARNLTNMSLETFENEFCQHGRRIIIPVFDLDDSLANKFIVVCGRGAESKLEDYVSTALSEEDMENARLTLEFRQTQSSGVFRTQWLHPEMFELPAAPAGSDGLVQIRRGLMQFQPSLSAIYMADFVVQQAGNYVVEYRGLGKSRLEITPEGLKKSEPQWEQLYRLYRYAYDGRSADKLEIAQQFISLIAQDIDTLCGKASDIHDAAKKTYDGTLVEKVEDYFKARQDIQERLQAAITEASNDAISLSRDVSSDLYKFIGVMAVAIAGILFRTDVGLAAVFVGMIAIAIYVLLVRLYHLPTLESAADLRKKQHENYIRSFSDVLSSKEIEGFVGNENWKDARDLFTNRHGTAKIIYVVLLAVALIAALCAGILMYDIFWKTPNVPTPNLGSQISWKIR